MAQGGRRAMGWYAAWRGMVPVYGLAGVLHVLHPAFALPAWVAFAIYAYKVLGAATAAEDPWRGRGSPRPYLAAFLLVYGLELLAFLAPPTPPSLLGNVVALFFAAVLVARSAPPPVRAERALLGVGLAAMIASGAILPAVLLGGLEAYAGLLTTVIAPMALAVASAAAFSWADRVASSRKPVVARKVRRE